MEIDRASRADDVGKLLLRLAVGGLLLFHGIAKVTGGVAFVEGILEGAGLPAVLAYGTYVGEVIAPILVLVGFLTRPAAAIIAFDMVMAIGLALREQIFRVKEMGGGLAIELEAFFLLGALALVFLGSGGYAVKRSRPARSP